MTRGDGIRVRGWDDLQWWGIEYLTAEADGTGLRALFDLKNKGCEIMEKFLGTTIQRGNGWNDTRPDSASMMLPVSIYRSLAIFCLMHEGHEVVVDVRFYGKGYSSDFIDGMTKNEWEDMKSRADLLWPNHYRVYELTGNVHDGTRCYHQIAMRSA